MVARHVHAHLRQQLRELVGVLVRREVRRCHDVDAPEADRLAVAEDEVFALALERPVVIQLEMFVRAYKHSGLQGTKDHDSLIVQGSTVGGSTVINNAIFLRADLDRVLRDWTAAGAPVERAPLEAAYTEIEQALHVTDMDPTLANRGANVFLDGCAEHRGL